jgi:GIY-YIG catalytic domain-containing protein
LQAKAPLEVERRVAITLNDLLLKAGIPIARVKLVRHQDRRARGNSLYEIWRKERHRFEAYQSIQSLKRFDIGDLVVAFVVTPPPSGDTLLAGLYVVRGVAPAPAGSVDPLDDHDVTGLHLYQLDRDDRLDDYVGRLTVEWGGGYRTWCQVARRHDKAIKEIRNEVEDEFPGFDRFSIALEDLPRMYPTWKQVLRNFRGVYVLVDRDSGQLYVGSATGDDRLWGRLLQYADGHGGNVGLRAGDRHRLQFSVLQVASSEAEALRLEAAWKQKLLSRELGLNRN